MDLNTVWFALVVALLTGYALLDGFDLGVGILHPLAQDGEERRMLMSSIAPVWDGNEVWLLTGGGAIFAAFPNVYATLFSGFYLALILLLAALILRALSLEFRGQRPEPSWRNAWDWTFAGASLVASLLLGTALGNIVRGVPIGTDGEFSGSFLGLLNPYGLLMGAFACALFALHGALYLGCKTEGSLREKALAWAQSSFNIFGVLLAMMLCASLFFIPRIGELLRLHPAALALPLLAVLAAADVRRELGCGSPHRALLALSASIVLLAALFGASLYPDLLPSLPSPENSLDIYNACSSPKTLKIMLVIALTGMPVVVAYQAFVYRIFRGKVRPDAY
ncbi:MAG: cytochrome d ubiquinol oxidase subunit II [Elusimicrobiota bacterium]|jgi:cytochrome d ubiquinol oxidase subunit II